MELRIIRLTALTGEDVHAWRALADAAAEPNPNADPRFLIPSLGHGIGAEEVRLAVVADASGAFRLALPFTVGSRIAGVRASHLTTHGPFMHEFASKNHPLVRREGAAEAFDTLFRGLRRHGLPDLVDVTVLPVDSVVFEVLEELHRAGRVRVIERVRDERAYARREDLVGEENDGWYAREGDVLSFPTAHLSSRSRRALGQYGRQIERAAGGSLELTRHDDDPAIVDEFLELQAAGWKGDQSLTGPQFRRKGHEAWFRAVAESFRADGALRALRLSAGGATVYLAVNLVSGGRSFGFHDVFDERFRKSSPGFVGRLAHLGHTLEEPGSAPFDPGMEPWYTQANSAFPSRRTHANLLVAGPSVGARSTVRALPYARRLRDTLRAVRGRTSSPPEPGRPAEKVPS